MIKYVGLSLSALIMLGGCVGQPKPRVQPKPVVKVEQPKPAVQPRRLKKGEVPPLPEREVDVDMDSMVDQAAAEVMNDDNAVQR